MTTQPKDFLYALPLVTDQAPDSFPAAIKELKLKGFVRYEPHGQETIVVLTQSGALHLHPDPHCEWHKGGFCGGCTQP